MMRIGLIFLIFLITHETGFAQNQKYSILWGDDEIGSLSVSRIRKGAQTDISFIAEVEFRVIVKYRRRTEYQANFINDTLYFASTRSVMNDNLKDYQTTKKENNLYKIFRHPSDESILKKAITNTVAKLYYEEPDSKLNSVYAEGQSRFCKLESLGSGRYKIYLDEGKENIYTYKAGRLEQVEVNRSWFDLVFKRIE